MQKYYKLLQTNELFADFQLFELTKILGCLSARVSFYHKKDIIIQQGSEVKDVGIVLSGGIQVIQEDLNGNINILSHLGVNDVFAETFAYANLKECPVTVQATNDSEIMFIDCKRLLHTCSHACVFHWKLIENMLAMIAKKNVFLSQKMEIISKRSIREKLLAFFNTQITLKHTRTFTIAYNREALAFYLGVDRSALSRELSRMQNDGLIKFNKNHFEIL